MLTEAIRSDSNTAANTVFSDRQFALWTQLLQTRLGMDPRSLRPAFLSRVLSQRLYDLGLDDMQAYYDFLLSGTSPGEWVELLDRVTTHETRFFRQPGTLQLARQYCLGMMQKGRQARIWSAGCASGEETWSLAMLLADSLDSCPGGDFVILGTDISVRCLQTAHQGRYEQGRTGNTPAALADRYFVRHEAGAVSIADSLRRHTMFACYDVLDRGNVATGSMDLVYCHNMLIYMDQDNRARALDNMVAALATDGILITGPGETRNWDNSAVCRELAGDVTIYRKIRS